MFVFDASQPNKRTYLPLAKNALRKLRTVRHPDVLKFLDAVETETTVYIMTERVRPLAPAIQERASKSAQEKEDWLLWGLHRISVSTLKRCLFVNSPVHRLLSRSSTSRVHPLMATFASTRYSYLRRVNGSWVVLKC